MLLAVLEDEMYSSKFSDYISHHKNMFIDFIVFTGISSIKDFVKNSKIDILLVNANMACELVDIKNIKKVIVLSDGTYTGQQGYPVIFKYQSAEHIIKEIFAQAADDDQITGASHMYSSKQAELIAVFSPFGGAGASTYARNMCAEMIIYCILILKYLTVLQNLKKMWKANVNIFVECRRRYII